MTTVTLASTAGFCFGVNRAADLIERLLAEGKHVATLGPLIHNRQYTDDLKRRGVVEVDSPDEAPDGAVLVLRTHGVTADVLKMVRAAGRDYIDAACPFVQKIHRTVTEKGKDA
ncbi:MAG: bifunctional 4-hydroxy-3-methylbut-2-enyl diphosphate reductase/30S ribosomal protein S1, partial [Clostridia bacterium]|nr:bifunctional 4-hydroxy-3-methylbut-2-enyl diphosphate reductase/30S ribosomal protein S1 [Clostridia bacterium]